MNHVKCYIPNYPRPQFVRKDWVALDGEWAFGFDTDVTPKDALKGKLPRVIRVPFCYEYPASGIGIAEEHKQVWYAHTVTGKAGKRTVLNIDGADYVTEVYVNGAFVGSHVGAYTRFSFDLTDHLKKGENLLVITCKDGAEPFQVRGKQRWLPENHGCWYVQTTGIYKSVWLEYVDEVHLERAKMTPSTVDNTLNAELYVSAPADDVTVDVAVYFRGQFVNRVSVCGNERTVQTSIRLDSTKLVHQVEMWMFDWPNLYDVEFTVRKAGRVTDEVGSYFGLREFRAHDGKLLLNNQPVNLRMLLDQGYWTESGLTPPSEEAIIKDIELTKQMGYNAVRKHQKTEDERFYYYADIMGLGVWCEMPSNHWYGDEANHRIIHEWTDIVRQYYNFPSLIVWVVFNESWGVRNIATDPVQQNLANGLYWLTKSFDPMRPAISNDGWVHTTSDILTLHHYDQDPLTFLGRYDTPDKLVEGWYNNSQHLPYAFGYGYEGQPIIISEFGGTAYVGDTGDGAWGYGNAVTTDEEYLERFKGLVYACKSMPGVVGYCYTQTTDVQQEVNGVLKEDRTPKVPIEKIRKINLADPIAVALGQDK